MLAGEYQIPRKLCLRAVCSRLLWARSSSGVPIVTSTLDELWWQHCCKSGRHRRQPKVTSREGGCRPKATNQGCCQRGSNDSSRTSDAAALRATTESLSNLAIAVGSSRSSGEKRAAVNPHSLLAGKRADSGCKMRSDNCQYTAAECSTV